MMFYYWLKWQPRLLVVTQPAPVIVRPEVVQGVPAK